MHSVAKETRGDRASEEVWQESGKVNPPKQHLMIEVQNNPQFFFVFLYCG